MMNPYMELKLAEIRRAELEEQAEQQRTVQKLIQWIKKERKEAAEAVMQKPEVTIYDN
jgi:molybdopterin converting factor small subunit